MPVYLEGDSPARRMNNPRFLVASAALALWLASPAHAERLPLRTYTTADGLVRNIINVILQDSRGYLWIGTSGGLSRFDGYGFVNYGMSDGLPSESVQAVLEDREGRLWVEIGRAHV